jgi:dienelactone hydrolase
MTSPTVSTPVALACPTRFVRNLGLLAMATLALTSSLRAADEKPVIDLKRTEPVPADQQIPVADFFRPVRIYGATINDAGSHVAGIVSTEEDKDMLMILDLDSWKPRILRGSEDKDVYTYHWLTDDRIMFSISRDKRWADSMMVARIDKKKKAYHLIKYASTRTVGIPRDNPLRPIVWVGGGTEGKDNLGAVVLNAKLNVDSGKGALESPKSEWAMAQYINQEHIVKRFPEVGPEWGQRTGYMADRDGNLAYAYTIRNGVAKMHILEGKSWNPSPIDLEAYDVHTVADQSGKLLVSEAIVSGEPPKIYELDVATGEVGEMIFQDENYTFTGSFYRDRSTRNVVGAIYNRAGPVSVWFDEKYQQLQKSLNSFFPKKVVRIADSNVATDRYIVRVYSDRDPVSYHLVDLKNQKVTEIAKSRPWIDPQRMQRMNIIQFKTADGEKLDAYVTLPAGASKENPPPLVVLPHGGPWVRDYWGYSSEVQFLASRGYAVLQPNYRGSTGQGWKFTIEDQWDFVKMHEDVTRATKTLIRSGYVDPDRVAIMGASFGGYLAIMGAVHEPDLYKCAITFAGVFDWEESVKMAARLKNENPEHQIFIRRLGDPKVEAEKYDRFSPGRRVDRIKIPVFVAHGKDDTIVYVGESKRLIRSLEENGIEYETLLLGGEGHGNLDVENAVKYYSRVEDFLTRHL